MTPLTLVQRELQVLELELEPQMQRKPELELEPQVQREPVLEQARVQEPELSELHVFLARLPLQRGSTQHI